LEKWEILNIVFEDVDSKTHTLLEQWDFCARNIDEVWDLLKWLSQDTYEFEASCANPFNPSPCIPSNAFLAC